MYTIFTLLKHQCYYIAKSDEIVSPKRHSYVRRNYLFNHLISSHNTILHCCQDNLPCNTCSKQNYLHYYKTSFLFCFINIILFTLYLCTTVALHLLHGGVSVRFTVTENHSMCMYLLCKVECDVCILHCTPT